ncbi:MAG: glycosyltransferase family 4 protein [Pseudanabaenaceae cyanobacterium bins.68]|nr:glycosyltransferase family 4 protein [Pseudanabaenaceae cyanobacterium bins.68]
MTNDQRHILYVLPYLEQGGTEAHVLDLIKHFGDRYQVSLVAPVGKGSDLVRDLGDRYQVFGRLDFNWWRGGLEFRQAVQAIQTRQPIDLVHVHGGHELIWLTRWGLGFPSLPILFTAHGYHGSRFSYRAAAWFVNRFAQGAIAVCGAEQQLLLDQGINPHKLHLIYNGINSPPPNPQRCQAIATQLRLDPANQVIIGTAARLSGVKGLTYLIQAFSQLPGDHLRLVIAGSGELEAELKQMCVDLGLRDRVIFPGHLPDLANLLELYDLFVLPSLQEACSLACAEAMAKGKPIIGTRVGGIPEQVLDGYNGWVVPPADAAALAAKLSQLIANPDLIGQFGLASRDRYQQLFTATQMLDQTARLYQACFP